MGFSGGGSNVLKPHTHDGTVVQDGGSLNMNNVTQASLTAGDIVYSDGVHLQRLAIGTPAQQIQVNAGATAPEYFTAGGASSTFVMIDEQTAAGTSADTGAHADCDNYQELAFNCFFIATDTNDVELQFYDVSNNLITSAHYQINGTYGGVAFQNNDTTGAQLTNGTAIATEGVNVQVRIFNKKGAGVTGGMYSVATYGSGGSGSIYNRGMGACGVGSSCAAVRGFKIISNTMTNSYWNLLGA
jgi:hypothetical protein